MDYYRPVLLGGKNKYLLCWEDVDRGTLAVATVCLTSASCESRNA
jgi:hypothetical protein